MMRSRSGRVMGVVIVAVAAASLCLFLGPCSGCRTIEGWWKARTGPGPLPPQKPLRVVPCKEIVDDLRSLWGFERNYAYRHKELASSISKMGDGVGIGKEGFVLIPSLWDARIDDNTNAVPAKYRIVNSKTGKKETVGAYRFGIIPVLADGEKIDRFSAILFAVPEVPADDDCCFIALCGPVNLQNDFSFDKEWPMFQLNAAEEVVGELLGLRPASMDKLKQRLESGDLKRHVTRTFQNLYYPKDGKK